MIRVLEGNNFNFLLYGLIGLGIMLVFSLILALFIIRKKKKPVKEKKTLAVSEDVFISHIGGKDNIISYKLVGSRLSLELKDYSLVDKEALKADNIEGIIEMSNKIVLVKEDLSEELKILESTKQS